MDPVKIGKAIKKLRCHKGYTQRALGSLLHVTDKAISKWERGLSVPDISIITELSHLLNCDIDNLLEGNIAYMDTGWQGLLVIPENVRIYSGTEIFGKPMVYILFSYFMLAGIRNIYVICPERDIRYIESEHTIENKCGVRVTCIKNRSELREANTMVVYNNPFVYGSGLTRYFQRAMAKLNSITVLSLGDNIVPITFVPRAFFPEFQHKESYNDFDNVTYETMERGMISYELRDLDDILQTACFMRYLEHYTGCIPYDLEEIANNRGLMAGEKERISKMIINNTCDTGGVLSTYNIVFLSGKAFSGGAWL